MATLTPRDETDLVEIVREARDRRAPIEIVGRGTRRALGRPVEAPTRVDLSEMTGITLYEPSELVLTARAGTSLSEIAGTLALSNQEMAFEPIDHSALFGHTAGAGTIGGLVGVGAAGPRRLKVGSARDHLLGFRGVNGFGDAFKSGGRVMKNVTGFDLSKLVTGSFGTLTVLTEVTLKVLPRAETEETVAILGLDDRAGLALLREASGSPQEVSSVAHLPAGLAGPFGDVAATLFRLEGPAVSVASREADLVARWRGRGAIEILGEDASRALWASLREAAPIAGGESQVWRISVAPSAGAAAVEAIRTSGVPIVGHFWDWAGGEVWMAVEPAADAAAAVVRRAVEAIGGHATLIRAAEAVRAGVAPFHPQPAALAALTARVKRAFDPDGLFNPGRMVEGV
ncbi:MAG: FAD-binding protein [Siculibacillus sp.]|nr:FAD-binding protein [Siculibacillus sp.]